MPKFYCEKHGMSKFPHGGDWICPICNRVNTTFSEGQDFPRKGTEAFNLFKKMEVGKVYTLEQIREMTSDLPSAVRGLSQKDLIHINEKGYSLSVKGKKIRRSFKN